MTRRFLALGLAALALAGCSTAAETGAGAAGSGAVGASAGARVTVLVAARDDEPRSLPRSHPATVRAVDAVGRHLADGGYAVIDETMAAPGIGSPAGRRRGEAEIFGIADSITQPPIDVVVTVRVHGRVVAGPTGRRAPVTVDGRALNLSRRQVVGGLQASSSAPPLLPIPCGEACGAGVLAAEAARLGAEVGAGLAAQLRR